MLAHKQERHGYRWVGGLEYLVGIKNCILVAYNGIRSKQYITAASRR